ncbi:hypothetical protein WNZ14_07160 [Hoeflea sp. AS60]|uniref:hypothetical protein n=1 Tax=Hoeflea sp. AS60 TaxID=3135780 RepID=UPI0031780AF9
MAQAAPSDSDTKAGAYNLLINCGGFKRGEKLLILHEDPALGWYDQAAPLAVAETASELGLVAHLVQVGAPSQPLDPVVSAQIAESDKIVYFARIGDEDRFGDAAPGKTSVMSYIRSAAMLASAYGRLEHQAMLSLKQAVNDVLARASRIDIECPLGTQVTGSPITNPNGAVDVSMRRFPMGVPAPVSAERFSGRVALAGYLTPSGNRAYAPAWLALEKTIYAEIENGRILDFSGDAETVASVRNHYHHVSSLFGIDAGAVHSWHAGIHPGVKYDMAVADDPDRWSNTIFTSPGYLHFHTCGAYAPGEICWMLANPGVCVDGVALWSQGQLRPELHDETRSCLEAFPALKQLFDLA